MRRRLARTAGWVLLWLALPLGAADPAPPTRALPVIETYFGNSISDPYRWLEDTDNADVQAWMKAQNAHTRSVLDRIAGRAALAAKMKQAEDSAAARVTSVTRLANGMVFFLRRETGADQPRLYVRTSLESPDVLLVDPQGSSGGSAKPRAIYAFFPSPSGRYVAYSVAESGSERAFLHVLEVKTRREMIAPVGGAEPNGSAIQKWLPDESGLYVVTFRDPASVAHKAERRSWPMTLYVSLNPAHKRVVPVVDGKAGVGPSVGAIEFAYVLQQRRSSRALLFVWDGTRREIRLLAAPSGRIDASSAWREIVSHDDDVVEHAVAGDRLYLLTHKNAPRFEVLKTSLSKPDVAHGSVVLPQGSGVITGIAAAADALYATVREGGRSRVVAISHRDGKMREIALPFAATARIASSNPEAPGILLELGSWTRANQFYEASFKSGRAVLTALQPLGSFDALDDMEVELVFAPSHDGTEIPLSIVHRRGLARNGASAAVLTGYGAYGLSQEPHMYHVWTPWLQRGGIEAVCHVRGGGEYGDTWYKAGWKSTKANSWKDFIACAEYLVGHGYTSPSKLGAIAWSAGGITLGRAFTERPDLFAAVVPTVALLDMLRFETDANGAPNVPEFGSVKRAEDFESLLYMSAYAHVVDGTRYPAVLLPHGVNDPRVPVWHSMKMAARLQAASASGRPVLLDLDYEAGHGVGSGQAQRIAQFADSLGFMLWQFGDPAFQPE